MKYSIEFELPNNKTIEDELQGSYVSWSIWGYSGIAKAKPVAEPKKGRWIIHGEPPMYVIECSFCGQKYFNHVGQSLAKYCSNCGTKMEVGE